MNKKISLVGLAARDAAITGANYLADAVKSSFGPFGQNAMIEKGSRITNDGFTISREVRDSIDSPFEKRGALVFHEACSKTNDEVGDATTTSSILAQEVLREALRYLPKEGISGKKAPAEIRKQIEIERDEVITALESMVSPITSKEELINSALVSVEDETLANLIGSAQWDIGPNGVILVEETPDVISSIEFVNGIRLDNGLGATQLINRPDKGSLEADECAVILTNHDIMDFKEIGPTLDLIVKSGQKKIAIIARAFSSEAIKLCVQNAQNGTEIYPINAPYVNQAEVMRDLEAVTGARYIDREEMSLSDVTNLDVGRITKLVARRYDAIIAGAPNREDAVKTRADKLKKELESETGAMQRKFIETRIAQLEHGLAILKVGSHSDVDRQYLKDKADDAVNAVRLALQGGTVKGGGLAFKEIAASMSDDKILKRPIQKLYDQIMATAPEGFVIEDWVRDPFLVLKAALTNACNVAGTFATTWIIVATDTRDNCNHNGIQNQGSD
jgi:chaperonin GroEL